MLQETRLIGNLIQDLGAVTDGRRTGVITLLFIFNNFVVLTSLISNLNLRDRIVLWQLSVYFHFATLLFTLSYAQPYQMTHAKTVHLHIA